MTGRIITINEGGELRFQETAANAVGQTQYTATIKLNGDLTANRTLVIGDSDGVVQGLQPGTGWGVTKGGTGLTAIANNVLISGSGGDTAKTITAPTSNNQALLFDGTNIMWAPLDFTGVSNTTARNLDTINPGVYASQLGTELRFRTIVGSTGITVTQNPSTLGLSIDQTAIILPSSQVTGNFAFSRITGTVPVTQGGTGFATIAANQLIYGNGTNTVGVVSAPTASGQRLVYNGSTPVWTSMQDTLGGHIDLPLAETYNLNLKFPFNASIDSISIKTGTGTLTYQLLCDSTVASSGTASTTQSDVTLTSKTIASGQAFKLALSNITSVSFLAFSIVLTRTT